jgi:hypothetical protein
MTLLIKDTARFREDFGKGVTPDFKIICPVGRKQSEDAILTATLDRAPDVVAVKKSLRKSSGSPFGEITRRFTSVFTDVAF